MKESALLQSTRKERLKQIVRIFAWLDGQMSPP